MNIRQLSAPDAAGYRLLMLQAYTHAPDAFTSTADERAREPEDWWVNRISGPDGLSVVFGAFEGSQLVGTVALEFNAREKTRHKAHLIGMFVAPASRGLGAGTALLDAAIDYTRSRSGLTLISLTVTQGNEAAIRLYRAHGFKEFGVEPMAIRTASGYQSKVHMSLQLTSSAGKQCQQSPFSAP